MTDPKQAAQEAALNQAKRAETRRALIERAKDEGLLPEWMYDVTAYQPTIATALAALHTGDAIAYYVSTFTNATNAAIHS